MDKPDCKPCEKKKLERNLRRIEEMKRKEIEERDRVIKKPS